jgi:hypothetical protein
MTKPNGAGKVINIKCTEVSLPEFPHLYFGTHFDGSRLFDATKYLKQKDPEHRLSVDEFFDKFDFQIKAIAQSYRLSLDKLVYINVEGHQLIDGCLCYPFLSYIDPQFCAYMNEVVDEMFTTGTAISDTHLLTLVKKRLSPELLKQLWDGENNMA